MKDMRTQQISFYKKILWISLLVLATFFDTANASVLSIKAQKNISTGQRFSVDILIDPEDQSINSVEATLRFSPDVLSFNGFSTTQSSIPIWVEEPKEKQVGKIHFSGVIPGGVERLYDPLNTKNNFIPLVRMFFVAKTSGIAEFDIEKAVVLQNDGKGSVSPVSVRSTSMQILENNEQSLETFLSEDKTMPEPFYITLIERSVFGKTPRMIAFSAEDTASGISYYEVAIGDLDFKKGASPYPLPYRLFSYSVRVRAYDYSGNVREQQITIPGERPYGVGIFAVLMLVVFFVYRFYTRRSRKQ